MHPTLSFTCSPILLMKKVKIQMMSTYHQLNSTEQRIIQASFLSSFDL